METKTNIAPLYLDERTCVRSGPTEAAGCTSWPLCSDQGNLPMTSLPNIHGAGAFPLCLRQPFQIHFSLALAHLCTCVSKKVRRAAEYRKGLLAALPFFPQIKPETRPLRGISRSLPNYKGQPILEYHGPPDVSQVEVHLLMFVRAHFLSLFERGSLWPLFCSCSRSPC